MKILKVSPTHHMTEEQCISGQQLGITKNMGSKGLENGGNKSCCSRKRRLRLQMRVHIVARLWRLLKAEGTQPNASSYCSSDPPPTVSSQTPASRGLERAGLESESSRSGAGLLCHEECIHGEMSNTFKHHHDAACNVKWVIAKKYASSQFYLSLPPTHRLRMHNQVGLCQTPNRTWIPGKRSKSEYSLEAEKAKPPFPDLSLIWGGLLPSVTVYEGG